MNQEMHKAANHREAFETVVVTYRRRLYLYALQMLHSREDAEDAVQDAFIRAYRAYEKMDDKPAHNARLRAWLFKITPNVVRNRLRRKQLPRTSAVEAVPDDRSTPDIIIDRHATYILVERAIAQLPPRLLEAAYFRLIGGLTHGQIAEQCSKPLGTVKANVFRAKKDASQIAGAGTCMTC